MRLYLPDSVWTVPIRLEDAENLLEFYARNDEDADSPELPNCPGPLPQQRITNVVQELDSLFDASIMAIDLALVKGREWFRQVVEKTAPVFNAVWNDGLFTAQKNAQLLKKLEVAIAIMQSVAEGGRTDVPTPDKEPKPSIEDYDTAKRKEILNYALGIQRQHPEIATNIRIAKIVAEKYAGFRNFHFNRWKEECGIDFTAEAKAIRKAFMKGHPLPTAQSTSSKADAEAEMKEIFEMFRGIQKLPEMTVEQFRETHPPGSYMNDKFLTFYEEKTDCDIKGHRQLEEDLDEDEDDN